MQVLCDGGTDPEDRGVRDGRTQNSSAGGLGLSTLFAPAKPPAKMALDDCGRLASLPEPIAANGARCWKITVYMPLQLVGTPLAQKSRHIFAACQNCGERTAVP